jgi:hypothetical protein
MRNAYVPLLATLCLFATPVLAEQRTNEASGLQYTVPRGWSPERHGDMLAVVSPDGSTTLVFKADDFPISAPDELEDEIVKAIRKNYQNVNVTQKLTVRELNDLKQVQLKGTGKCTDGRICNWDVTLVTGGKKTLFMMVVGDTDKHETEINWVYRSIKKKEARSI